MVTILLVDDAAFIRMRLKALLVKNGYTSLIEAATGTEAIEKYKEYKPDLVLLDIVLPDMDGIAVLKEIIAADPQAKVVMVTSIAVEETIQQSVNAGAKQFLVKPFIEAKVIEVLTEIFKT